MPAAVSTCVLIFKSTFLVIERILIVLFLRFASVKDLNSSVRDQFQAFTSAV